MSKHALHTTYVTINNDHSMKALCDTCDWRESRTLPVWPRKPRDTSAVVRALLVEAQSHQAFAGVAR